MGRRSPSRAARSSTAAPSSTTGALVFTGHSRADRPADQVRPERFGSRAERDHRVGPSSRPVLSARRCAPCPARRAAPRGQRPVRRRGRRVPALRRPRADAHRLAQLEARLERVHVQPRRGVEPGQRLGGGHALEAAVSDEPPDDRAVLLLHPGLVVLAGQARERVASSPCARATELTTGSFVAPSSRSTPLTVVEVDAPRREGGQLSRRPQRLERERARPHHQRHALGRAGGDVGRHHRLGGRRPRSPRSGPRSRPPGSPQEDRPSPRRACPRPDRGSAPAPTGATPSRSRPADDAPAPPRCASPTPAGRSSPG